MKILTTVLAMVLVASMVQAQTPTSLKDDMKAIGGLFKKIGGALKDPSQNAQAAVWVDQLVANFQLALTFVPDSISQMPGAEQAAAVTEYKHLIQTEIAAATDMAAAFRAGNNAKAMQDYQDMNSTKKDGHGQFAN